MRGVGSRVYPVGRLDYLSEGLLLLTNDGELAQKLTHASSHVPKTYLVKISGKADGRQQIDKLRPGHHASGGAQAAEDACGREGKPGSGGVRRRCVRRRHASNCYAKPPTHGMK